MLFYPGEGHEYRFFVNRRIAIEMLHHLRVDISGDLPFLTLDDIHHAVFIQIGAELLYRIGGQRNEQF